MTKRTTLLLAACAVMGASFLLADQMSVEKVAQSLRRLSTVSPPPLPAFMDPRDDKRICTGPRRERKHGVQPFYEKAHYALHVGHSVSNGQVSDNIIVLFNALDTAMSSGNQTVVVVSNWAEEFLNTFFPDDESWERAAQDIPIVRATQAADLNLGYKPLLHTTMAMFIRGAAQLVEQNKWHETHARRKSFLHYLFSSLKGEPCHMWHQLTGYVNGKYDDPKYIAVILRNPKGGCVRFNHEHHEQCKMDPDYVKTILEPTGLYGKRPIVLIGDMKEEAQLHRLQEELKEVVVPKWDMGSMPSIFGDIVIGGMSEFFLGNEGCAMSRNIGVVREAFGKDTLTNYVFVNKKEDGYYESVISQYPYDWPKGEIDGSGIWP